MVFKNCVCISRYLRPVSYFILYVYRQLFRRIGIASGKPDSEHAAEKQIKKWRRSSGVIFLFFYNHIHPYPFFDQDITDQTLDNINELANEIKWYNMHSRVSGQNIRQRNINQPRINAVKEKGNQCLSTGT